MKIFFFATLCFLGILTNCVPVKSSPIVLKVGISSWTVADVSEELHFYLKNFKNSPEKVEEETKIKKKIIEDLILKSLIRNWIKKNNIKTSEPKFFKNFKDLPFLYASSSKKIKEKFIEQNTYEAFLNSIKKQSKKFSKQTQLNFYKKNRKMFFKPQACKLKQILVNSEELAKLLRNRFLNKETFSKLAELYSRGPEKKSGGNLGWVSKGTLEVFDTACALSTDSLSPVLKSPYGFHVLKTGQKRKGFYAPFKEVRLKIQSILAEQHAKTQFETWLKQELQSQPVFINEKVLAQIHIRYRKKKL